MPERAHVSSTDAIVAFRSALLMYLSKARQLLEGACEEIHRTRVWLEHDQRVHWEQQLRRRARDLEAAQQALFSARMSPLQQPTAAQLQAVQRQKRSVDEAEDHLRRVKHWTREFDNRAAPSVRQLESLRTLLAHDLPKAAAYLDGIVQTLEEYARIPAPPASS